MSRTRRIPRQINPHGRDGVPSDIASEFRNGKPSWVDDEVWGPTLKRKAKRRAQRHLRNRAKREVAAQLRD